MLARDCGVYANRNPAAHEVRDDEGSLWYTFGDFPRNGKVTPPGRGPAGEATSRVWKPLRVYSFACSCSSTRFLAQSQANTPEPRAQAARWAAR